MQTKLKKIEEIDAPVPRKSRIGAQLLLGNQLVRGLRVIADYLEVPGREAVSSGSFGIRDRF